MTANLEKAVSILNTENLTLAAVGENGVLKFTERGVKPLLALIDGGKSLAGFSAADKVVGKAAAMLYVLLGVNEIYASVISKLALAVLRKYGIYCEYGTLTDAIKNRTNTGFCPMETAVLNIETPAEALAKIREKFAELQKNETKHLTNPQ